MTVPVYISGITINDNGELEIDADALAEAGVGKVKLVDVPTPRQRAERALKQWPGDTVGHVEAAIIEATAQLEAQLAAEKARGDKGDYKAGQKFMELWQAEERAKDAEAQLAEADAKLSTEMAEHTREVLRHAVTKNRAEMADARNALLFKEKADAVTRVVELEVENGKLCGQVDDAVAELVKANALYSECLNGNRVLRQRAQEAEEQGIREAEAAYSRMEKAETERDEALKQVATLKVQLSEEYRDWMKEQCNEECRYGERLFLDMKARAEKAEKLAKGIRRIHGEAMVRVCGRAEKAEADAARLKTALSFYAHKTNLERFIDWILFDDKGEQVIDCKLHDDITRVAEEALAPESTAPTQTEGESE